MTKKDDAVVLAVGALGVGAAAAWAYATRDPERSTPPSSTPTPPSTPAPSPSPPPAPTPPTPSEAFDASGLLSWQVNPSPLNIRLITGNDAAAWTDAARLRTKLGAWHRNRPARELANMGGSLSAIGVQLLRLEGTQVTYTPRSPPTPSTSSNPPASASPPATSPSSPGGGSWFDKLRERADGWGTIPGTRIPIPTSSDVAVETGAQATRSLVDATTAAGYGLFGLGVGAGVELAGGDSEDRQRGRDFVQRAKDRDAARDIVTRPGLFGVVKVLKDEGERRKWW